MSLPFTESESTTMTQSPERFKSSLSTKSLNIIPVEWIDEVISSALIEEPTPSTKKIKSQKSKNPDKSENKQPH